jgi:hypothetical protein
VVARADVVVGDAAATNVLLRREFARYVVLERCRGAIHFEFV